MSDTTYTLLAGIIGAVASHQAIAWAQRQDGIMKPALEAFSVFAAVITAIAWMKIGLGLRS